MASSFKSFITLYEIKKTAIPHSKTKEVTHNLRLICVIKKSEIVIFKQLLLELRFLLSKVQIVSHT